MYDPEKRRLDGLLGAFNGNRIRERKYKSLEAAQQGFYDKYKNEPVVAKFGDFWKEKIEEFWKVKAKKAKAKAKKPS